MSDMRLIVAGAGGRMGRTLDPGDRRHQGRDARGRGRCAGLGRDRARCRRAGRPRRATASRSATDVEPLLAKADGLLDFTIPAATVAFAELAAAARPRPHHRHHRAHRREREADRRGGQARRHRQVRQHEHGRQSAGGAGQARGEDARRGLRHRDPRDAPQQEGRRAVRHRADARPGGGRRPRHRSRSSARQRGRDGHTGARHAGRHRLCVAARRHRGRRSHA